MALLPKLRQLIKRPASALTVATRRPSSASCPEQRPQEDALRAMLTDDPNNARAFVALAEIVRRRAGETGEASDPLTADLQPDDVAAERERRGDLAVWALGEELAGHPRAWYPLIELARLSVEDDLEGALRRLNTAAERDPSGTALAEGLIVLRESGRPGEAVALGVGHWRVKEHTAEVGKQLVLAAVDSGRIGEAERYLASMADSRDRAGVAAARTELLTLIATASKNQGHGI